jgi:hypothetical protein
LPLQYSQMSTFKLLAIRPLKNCDSKYLKNLTPDQLYRFYNGFVFANRKGEPAKSGQEIKTIKNNSTTIESLYNVKAGGQNLSVNISAIAGKNGTGKSSLVELLFAVIYLFSVKNNFLKPNLDSVKQHRKNLRVDIRDAKLRLLKLNDKEKKIVDSFNNSIIDNQLTTKFDELKTKLGKFIEEEEHLKSRLKYLTQEFKKSEQLAIDIEQMGNELSAEIYFQFNNTYFRLTVGETAGKDRSMLSIIENANGEQNLDYIAGFGKKIDIEEATLPLHFFYTIAVNYSHYALNAGSVGEWINALFHKNDGYTTPLVINPMRTNGNFDINDEIVFAKYRLTSNALIEYKSLTERPKRVALTEHQFIQKVKFTLNKKKVSQFPGLLNCDDKGIWGEERAVAMINDMIDIFFKDDKPEIIKTKEFPLKDSIVNYIIHKTDLIVERYVGFEQGYQLNNDESNKTFLENLLTDGSHITYKLRQALNFLMRNTSSELPNPFEMTKDDLSNDKEFMKKFTLSELNIYIIDHHDLDIIPLLPPPIFDIDFELANNKKSKSLFSQLSSGEQQLIHTIQSVIYHLNNVQSVHLSKAKRIKYQAVNIIYDEIELYFHPEYQRNFIKKLLSALEHLNLKEKHSINAVNILFLTHSPFILSDIPSENIMLLEIDKKTAMSKPSKPKSQTFAANINDLLADGFFLKRTLMGNYAESKIQQVIDKMVDGGKANEEDEAIIEMIGDSFLKSSLERYIGK